jgi:hypothetical protein
MYFAFPTRDLIEQPDILERLGGKQIAPTSTTRAGNRVRRGASQGRFRSGGHAELKAVLWCFACRPSLGRHRYLVHPQKALPLAGCGFGLASPKVLPPVFGQGYSDWFDFCVVRPG